MEIDWERNTKIPKEFSLCIRCFNKALEFLRSIDDPTVKARYEGRDNALKFRSVVVSIILNALDAVHLGERLVASKSNIPQDYFAQLKIDWPYVEATFHALVSVDAIKFEPERDQDTIAYAASTLLTQQQHEQEQEGVENNPLEHSRQLDVHTWSDHPEVNCFVDEIYAAHFDGGNARIRKKHLKVILLDLYIAWSEDPYLKIAISRDANAYRLDKRYNQLSISDKTIVILDRLIELNLIEQAIGFYDRGTGKGRKTRVWPTQILVEMFKAAKFGSFDIDSHFNEECIILRDIVVKRRKMKNSQKLENYDESVDVKYRDDDNTKRMRAELTEYNDLLHRTFIDIPTLEQPYIDIGKNKKGKDVRIFVNQRDKFVRRIFNRSSWEKGGRFWGGWWQRCPKEWRHQIFMNDEPITEIDYSGLHVVILYAQEGIDYWKKINTDPYTIEMPDLGVGGEQLRSICKQLVLVALNAKDEKSTFQAFRGEADTGTLEKSLKDIQLKLILQMLRNKHAPIAHKFASDAGIDLMRVNSEITARIIQYFTDNEVPIITIHDSYIVPIDMDHVLNKQMVKAFEHVTGIPAPKLKEESHNPDKWEPLSLEDAEGMDYAAWEMARKYRFDPPRSKRYQHQYWEFNQWLAN